MLFPAVLVGIGPSFIAYRYRLLYGLPIYRVYTDVDLGII